MSEKVRTGFEWFVAWRHLRDPERRSRRALYFGLVVLLLASVDLTALKLFGQPARTISGLLAPQPSAVFERLWMAGTVGVIVGAIIVFMGVLLASFTVFTAISIFGVFLGTSAPILALSVMSGFEVDLKNKIRGAKADVVITTAEDQPFVDWRKVRQVVLREPGVVGATPYLEAEVMIRAGAAPAGIILRGIDPETARSVLDLGRTLREGSVDDLEHPDRVADDPFAHAEGEPEASGQKETATPPNPGKRTSADAVAPDGVFPSILLGEELSARTLRVFRGSHVDVVCPLCKMGPSGPMPGLKVFRAAGHFYSGMYEYDSKLAYVALDEAQRFLGAPGEVTGIDLRTDSPDAAPAVASAVQIVLGERYEVRSWEDLNKGLFMALRLEKIAMFVVMTFIALVASFSIISTLIMMATQKAREVAILKAMGAGVGAIQRVFIAEGVYIGLLGLAVGVPAGILGCKLIEKYGLPLPTDVYYISKLPVVMRPSEILVLAASAMALCCLATVYPALLASRMRPVDGLRYE
jgi:lipoprotein-releasing system permease protein